MATANVPRSKKNAPVDDTASRPRKSRGFRLGCWIMLGVLAVSIALAPTIIAKTPLGDWVLQSALQLEGTVSVGSISLGWFSSATVENLVLSDSSGEAVIEIESLTSDKPLIAMLLDVADLGRLHIAHPTVHIVFEEKTSNLEQMFAPLLAKHANSNVSAQLDIIEGKILIDDRTAGRQFRLENLALDCTLANAQDEIKLVASGSLPGEVQPGSFKLDLQAVGLIASDSSAASGKLDCQTSALPLELVQPFARRIVERCQLSGQVSTRFNGAWGAMAEGGETAVGGESLITGLKFSAAMLGKDRIELDRIELPCRLVQHGELVQVEELGINCELGQMSLSGSVKMSDFTAADKLSALAHENYELKGNVDLAKLAAMLPHSLRIRDDTEITSGQISLAASGRQQPEGMTWTGHIDTSHLGAHADNRNLVWENPLSIQFATHETKSGIVVDQIDCKSEFLEINAAGSLDNLTASAKFDLTRLIAELKRFSDLNHAQMAGSGVAQLIWKRTAEDHFSAEAEFQARGFQWVAPQGRAWKEDNLVARLDLAGQLSGQSVKSVESAKLTVTAGNEQALAQLQEAVSDPAGDIWPVECTWLGQLAHWAPRLEAFGVTGWTLAGTGSLKAVMNCSRKAIAVEQAKFDVAKFDAVGHGWFVSEPTASATIVGNWDLEKSRIEVAEVQLSAGNAVATMSHAALLKSAAGWTLNGGDGQLDADMAQLTRWHQDPRTPVALQIAGRLKGETQLKHEQGVTSGQLNGTIDRFQIADISHPNTETGQPAVWQEPKLTLSASGNYQHTSEQLQLDKLQIASAALRCDATGTVGLAEVGGAVDLKGTVQYDWQKLAPLWTPYVGAGVQIVGQQTRTFALHGKLDGPIASAASWDHMAGEAAIGWTGMEVYGLQVGRGEIAAKLADGQLTTQPLDVEVSEGRLNVTPLVRLSPVPAELFLGRGPLLTDVHLTPELCAQGLKFVAPILSESTVADGRFSVTLDGGRLPLMDPGTGDMAGRMAIRAQAKPGPVAQEFMVLINEVTAILRRGSLATVDDQTKSFLSIDDSEIDFRLVNGRVYHRNLRFNAGAMPIQTYGSVGLDETLSIVAEIPLKATIFGIDLSLGTLEGQTLKIPIEGTLKNPKLDRRILQQLTGQVLQSTARGALIDGVNKQLQRLFPGQ